jgi:hypothetical protein
MPGEILTILDAVQGPVQDKIFGGKVDENGITWYYKRYI